MTQTPSNYDAEMHLLGAVLRDPEACRDFVEEFDVEDFGHYSVRQCWRGVKVLAAAGDVIDPSTVLQAVRKFGCRDVDAVWVADRWEQSPTAANAAYHAASVRDYSIRRQVCIAANRAINSVENVSGPAADALEAAVAMFRDIANRVRGGDAAARTIGDLMAEAAEVLTKKAVNKTRLDGLSTGLEDLDDTLGGLKDGELLVIGARPSQGKTALGVGIAASVAARGVPALLFSAEMPGRQIAERVLAAASGVNMVQMNRPDELRPEHIHRLRAAAREAAGTPLFVDDQPEMSAARIARVARRMKRDQAVAVVVVDYLQLLRAEAGSRNRHEEVGKLALRMKQLARDLNVPVILLSQLSREAERDSRPTLAHLKESGDIEAHADRVILIHRTGDIPPRVADPVEVDLIVAKNRNGPVGTVPVVYDRQSTTFKNKEKAR